MRAREVHGVSAERWCIASKLFDPSAVVQEFTATLASVYRGERAQSSNDTEHTGDFDSPLDYIAA